MSNKQSPAVRPTRGRSLVWKLTLRHTLRTAWLLTRVSLLVAVLFWIGIWVGVECAGVQLADGVQPGVEWDGAAEDGLLGNFFTVSWQGEGVGGLTIHPSEYGRLPPGTRRIDWDANPAFTRYTVAYPADGGYVFVVFRPGPIWILFRNAYAVLLAAQALLLIFGIFKTRRSVRRTLQPITELTLATQQSIYAQDPRPGGLHLSGTIDTINAITESHLDTRVAVPDERDELCGLALAINSMLDRLDNAYRAQLRFVSDASHELRTPIAVIQGYASLLERWGKEDEKTLSEAIAAISSEAAGMKELVEQLLFLARSDNNSIRLDLEDVDVGALAAEVVKQSEMIDQNHEYSCECMAGLHVHGDTGLLKQALRILVDNAVKYTPAGGRITVRADRDGEEIRMSVGDTGIGIAAEDLSKLFDRFFRTDASRNRQTGGTGLGLSIAKWIVDSHGGRIEALSREGIGTRMSILLPARAQAVSPSLPETRENGPS